MDATFAWMIGGGLRSENREPDGRLLGHLQAVRDAEREAPHPKTTPLARVATWFGYQPARVTASVAVCCSPA